ncbi:MAG: 13E12 repeat family protein, partial [Actinomycetota bacterium]|nr:13E12 repeat family protein [Actinomycetota bacterium]
MERTAVVETLEGIAASFAALAACVRTAAGEDGSEAAGAEPLSGDPLVAGDPLRDQADAYLDGLEELGRMEAPMAALKVHLAAGYAAAADALAARARSAQERRAHQMAVTAEVACALTVSERTADALLGEAQTLTERLPLTLATLQAGNISWQHARTLCDETANLEPAAAAALEAHFLDPDARGAARGRLPGELVPGRFRAKVRAWRERHHPVSLEIRHRRSAKDRRVEYS